jgi:hypothetical protein
MRRLCVDYTTTRQVVNLTRTNYNNSTANEIQTPARNDSRQGRCELVLTKNITFHGGRM